MDGILVKVSCRVLKLTRQPYYRWLRNPVTHSELTAVYRANALNDPHCDDLEFGYRLLVDEAHANVKPLCDRTAWKIASENAWLSTFGRKKARGKGKKPGPPVCDDLVQRDFTAPELNELWLTDITEY